jgi:hypothetical protein
MMNKDSTAGSYVLKVGADNLRYAQELLSENEKLRVLIASLKSDQRQLEGQLRALDSLRVEHEVAHKLVGTLEREKLHLQEQLLRLHEELDHHRDGELRLQRQLAEVETQNRHFSEEFVAVEQQNNNLMNLYVASYRLHGTLDRGEVLSTIQEIIANLVGSEEQAIFELNAAGTALALVASVGIDPAHFQEVPLGFGLIGQAGATGQEFVLGNERAAARPGEADLSACIPLKLNGKVTGAIALFRLLPQKAGLEAVDHELFDLLATHAATALYCTGLHAQLDVRA